MGSWNGERQIGRTEGEIEIKHVERYKFAMNYGKNKNVLDASCGCGYGTYILASEAKNVLGIDISQEAIGYATENWNNHNIKHRQFDLNFLSYKELGKFDVIVSLETIEHLKIPIAETLKKFTEILNNHGMLILSHPENEQSRNGGFHYHFNIKGSDIHKMLENLNYEVVADWNQPPNHGFDYHVIGSVLK